MMNAVDSMKNFCLALLLIFGATFYGCVSLVLSPRQQVVMSALQAMCETKNTKSLSPFVTDDARLVLDVADPLVNVLERTGIFRLSDQIAAACQDKSVKFGDEIKVSDDRYLVRLSSDEKKIAYELVVVRERGDWKISSVKR
jgi:hypothetical protein